MGNTVSVNVGNSGAVMPAPSMTGEDKCAPGPTGGINIGNTTALEEEEEEELACFEKLGCLLCGG
jgi:hypothetical protein